MLFAILTVVLRKKCHISLNLKNLSTGPVARPRTPTGSGGNPECPACLTTPLYSALNHRRNGYFLNLVQHKSVMSAAVQITVTYCLLSIEGANMQTFPFSFISTGYTANSYYTSL